MIVHRRLSAVPLFLAFLVLVAFPLPALAEISFSVSPIRVELSGESGGTHTDALEVRNEGNEKVRIKVSMQDWYLSEEGTPIFQKGGTQPRSCVGWMKINPVDFLLQAGEKKVVRYSVAIPPGIKEGGYWGAFIFETVPQVEPGQKTKAVAIKGNIGSIVYVVVGKPVPVGDIIDMSYDAGGKGRKILTKIKNNGTVHFRVKGSIKVNDPAGKTVQTVELPDVPVLADYSRTIPATLDDKLPAGSYTAVATIDIGDKSVLAGELPFVVK
ncbi:hypothetical protein [Geomobilimonas luticola]|uniref:P pilus assembly protein, chaperone PapD n=1 Tax=Geomobilimonas luticola TaxID=1114878 RepID=A0ABS5SD38_9BACT|nr:hypothetical protein [Geomobilimonas luticola]MBT0653283.1 hypothetical protein [Geomobilimonas luticola]